MTDITDHVPDQTNESRAIGFTCPKRYNASNILFDNLAAGRGEKLALLSDKENLSYHELCQRAAKIGNALLHQDSSRGDRVLLCLNDSADYAAAVFGAMRAGLVPVLVNTLSPADLMAYYAKDSSAKVALIHSEYVPLFAELSSLSPVALDTSQGIDWYSSQSGELAAADTGKDDMAFWMYSSGSTGRPKGVVHLHHDMAYTVASYAQHVLHIKESDVCFSVPKIFFAYGFGNSLSFPFAVGATTSLLSARPTPEQTFRHIKKYKPSIFFALPTVYTALIKHQMAQQADLSSIRLCISAAEVLSVDVFTAWKNRFGHEIIEGLGSTEVLHIYLSNTVTDKRPGSAGFPVPGYALKLTDRDGNPLEEQHEGILMVRGDSNAPCYFNRAQNTRETMRNGWIWTGDRFHVDDDGFYFFRGRADDLVKVSGQWVYPLEVELCLNEHPKVFESTVLAIQLADARMTIAAVIATSQGIEGNDTLSAELNDYVKKTLLPYKYPRRIVYLEKLPKTGTDKIDRQQCKALLVAQMVDNC
jgi:benzoate-CoA ligase family protein